jgi:type IV secretory pathway TraG/TraD family ATPase VirD4
VILRNILGQQQSSINLRNIMDSGKALIVDLSKGRIGEDASGLLGSLLINSLQLAAMSRADVNEEQRQDFCLYVDEFQNFATESFATILSEARKSRLSLTVANQYLAQMEESIAAAVFGNVGSLLSFQVGADDREVLAEQLGGDIEANDVMSLPKYTAYVRLLVDGLAHSQWKPSRHQQSRGLPEQKSSAVNHGLIFNTREASGS